VLLIAVISGCVAVFISLAICAVSGRPSMSTLFVPTARHSAPAAGCRLPAAWLARGRGAARRGAAHLTHGCVPPHQVTYWVVKRRQREAIGAASAGAKPSAAAGTRPGGINIAASGVSGDDDTAGLPSLSTYNPPDLVPANTLRLDEEVEGPSEGSEGANPTLFLLPDAPDPPDPPSPPAPPNSPTWIRWTHRIRRIHQARRTRQTRRIRRTHHTREPAVHKPKRLAYYHSFTASWPF